MIKVKNLTKGFFNKVVLENINLEIEEGKLTTLLGENGCGKSTLLNILSGYEFPDKGIITYLDEPLDSLNFTHKHDIFFVHEKLSYELPITVKEYISILKGQVPKWNDELFEKMVNDRKIDLDNNYQNFSRGQKMQIALMIGIASSPKVLLLDEITSVIDVYGRKYFLDLLEKYVQLGNTVVITTNIINELEFYTDNLIVLKNKKIALCEKVSEIPTNFIKIRNSGNSEHSIFEHNECVWSGVNSDKSISYIVPKTVVDEMNIPNELLDKRKSTLEDVFIFFFSREEKNGDENEDVA